MTAFLSLTGCNQIIAGYKGLIFLLRYQRAAVKVQNPQSKPAHTTLGPGIAPVFQTEKGGGGWKARFL